MEGEQLLLHCHVEGERSQGRQPKMWMTCIKEDITEQDKSIQQAYELIRGIDLCRHHHHDDKKSTEREKLQNYL